VSSSCPPGVKHTSEMDMTDGCGLINLHALHMLHEKLGLWKEVPVAIQCRLAGAKVLVFILLIYSEVLKAFLRDCCSYILARRRIAGNTQVSG
jgi:hypothetical protein